MKKYFAKYLPVEGEIEKGDWYKLYSHGMKTYSKKMKEKHGEYSIQPKWILHLFTGSTQDKLSKLTPKEDVKKVKLFLCTRDIQIGDEYYTIRSDYFSGPNLAAGVTDGIVWYEGERPSITIYTERDFAFKKIGEISPEATWVKEGDEFDEYEESHTLSVNRFYHWSRNEVLCIKVKCPHCGHFQ